MKQLYIEPDCGVAGDMLVAALLQLDGAPNIAELRNVLDSLPITETWQVDFEQVQRHAIAAGMFKVQVENIHGHEHHHGRGLEEIKEIISKADKIPDKVKNKAKIVFAKLADAESRVHGKKIQEVHFHEVGAVDAIIDIVSCCFIIESLQVGRIISSPIALGQGSIKSAHGVLPIPVPATLNLIEGLPVHHTGIASELATPTGTALLATLVDEWQVFPEGVLKCSSYGAGTRDLTERPGVIRLSIYEQNQKSSYLRDMIGVIECNFDDMPAEIFSGLSMKLLEMGALDYSLISTQMKKNRPGILLQILCKTQDIEKFADYLFHETTTLGIRYRIDERLKLKREILKIETPWGKVDLKTAEDQAGKMLKFKVEYESCAELAKKNGLPFLQMKQKLENFLTDKVF